MTDVLDRREAYLRAQALVSRVYALPEAEREPFLERETAADPRLREEVRWMLGALAAPDDNFLEAPAADLARESADLKVPAPRNYTLIRPLGEGGMGVVYLAERVEGELKQTVALKLLNLRAMLNPSVVSRFLTERQLLAKLNHPNIARLIDAGALADGRPFLAMEYVEGEELTHYCETKQLGIRARVQLFIKICQAVQYAHQHLIIHRDLKPSNVLVTGEGEPKLVDFGIARLWSDNAAATATVGVERIMTLAYASPEQLAGKPLSTMTDIYSLGIVLYELLAGERPWGLATEPLSLVREMGQSAPMPPSAKRRVTRGKTEAERRGLRGFSWRASNDLPRDLDAIVLKALRLEPEGRYESAQAFADDLQRFLVNQPVSARQGHMRYRACKFVHRHWGALTVMAGIVAMTGAYIVDRQMQLNKTERERAKVQQTRDFLVGLFREVQPAYAQGQNVTAKEMLDRGARRLEAAPPEDLTTRVLLNGVLADTYSALGDAKTAVELADRTIALSRDAADLSADARARILITAMSSRALNRDTAQAKRLAQEVISMAAKGEKVSPETHADALHWLANSLSFEGRPIAEVEPYFKQGIELLERKAPNAAELVPIKSDYAKALMLALRSADALAVLRGARADALRILGANNPQVYVLDAVYGEALNAQSRSGEARPILEQALAALKRLLGDDHFHTGTTRARLAFVLQAEENFAGAQPLLEQQLALTRKVHRHESQSTINALLNTAPGLGRLGRFDEGEALLKEALGLVKSVIATDRQRVWEGVVTSRLAELQLRKGAGKDARQLAERAIALLGDAADFATFTALSFRVLGAVAEQHGDNAAAEKAYRKALELSKAPRNTPFDLGPLLVKTGRFDEAEKLMLPAYQSIERQFDDDAPVVKRTRAAMHALYTAWGKREEAARYAAPPARKAVPPAR